MMKTSSLRYLAALALACCGLASCDGFGSGGAPDVINPSVAQQDDQDVRWGLPRRVSKSGARRRSGATTMNTINAAADDNSNTPGTSGTVSEEVKNKLR